jgi:hypothetical protein
MAKANKKDLLVALNKLLVLAKGKLEYAKAKNKEWDINHYTKDVAFIESEISIVEKTWK